MAVFEKFLPGLLEREGGWSDDQADPGGATNKGITLRTLQSCARDLLGVEPTLQNLRLLTDTQAGIIYRSLYWNHVHGDSISLQDLANMVCDFYVNAGGHAITQLQTVMNTLGAELGVDGVFGPGTLFKLSTLNQREIYRRYKTARLSYYEQLAAAHPVLKKFLNGWRARVNAFPDLPVV